MNVPTGWFIFATLFCTNPDATFLVKEWAQEEYVARTWAELMGYKKWFYFNGRKCLYKDVRVIKE